LAFLLQPFGVNFIEVELKMWPSGYKASKGGERCWDGKGRARKGAGQGGSCCLRGATTTATDDKCNEKLKAFYAQMARGILNECEIW